MHIYQANFVFEVLPHFIDFFKAQMHSATPGGDRVLYFYRRDRSKATDGPDRPIRAPLFYISIYFIPTSFRRRNQ